MVLEKVCAKDGLTYFSRQEYPLKNRQKPRLSESERSVHTEMNVPFAACKRQTGLLVRRLRGKGDYFVESDHSLTLAVGGTVFWPRVGALAANWIGP